jgi:phenylpropionate dioxygenase-like ring-hydroxylating dioxygenase large terminal subunit
VTKKEVGSSTVLGCRYHGWSYDTRGKLIKAPEFDNVEGFDKSENGLWEVNTEVWESMVFVNFDNRGQAASLSLKGQGQKLRRWKVAKMKVVGEWKMEGAFNWKLIGALH